MCLKRLREMNSERVERLKRAAIFVDAGIMEMREQAATLLAHCWREHRLRMIAAINNDVPDAVAEPSAFDVYCNDDLALAGLELPLPKPVIPAPVESPIARVPYSFDRKAARKSALGHDHAAALESIEEQAGNVDEMPCFPNYTIMHYLCSKKLLYDQRFIVLTFLTMNRVPPVLVVELFLAAGMLTDQSAYDHVLSMLRRMQSGNFDKYRAYCMETRMWEDVQPPRETRGGWYGETADWAKAIQKVRRSLRFGNGCC